MQCPDCGGNVSEVEDTFLGTRNGKPIDRKIYECGRCGFQFNFDTSRRVNRLSIGVVPVDVVRPDPRDFPRIVDGVYVD